MNQPLPIGFVLSVTATAFCAQASAGDGASQVYEIEFFVEKSHLLAVNDARQAVGYLQFFDTSVRTPHQFFDGTASLLAVPDALGVAAGINADGVMVGWDLPEAADSQALRWTSVNADAEFLSGLGGHSRARAINDAGVITGWSEDGPGRRAFRWTDGAVEILDTLGGTLSEGYAINAAGEIVGMATDARGVSRATIWTEDIASELAGFGADSIAFNLNENGVVVGTREEAGGVSRPVRWESGFAASLGTLNGANRGEAWAVDASGSTVIGHVWTSTNPEATETAFIWRDGAMTALRTLVIDGQPMVDTNLRLIRAYDINANGDIAGVAWYGGLRFGFILRPVAVSYEYEVQEIPAPPGAIDAFAHGLNDLGDVVGHAAVDIFKEPPYPAWRWRADLGVEWLPNLDSLESFSAEDINEDGRIVGSPPWEFGSAAWSYEDGTYQTMELPPGATWAFLTDINVHGVAAGFADSFSPTINSEQFFLWDGPGGLTLIPEVPVPIAGLGRMNNDGAVTGTTRFSDAFRWEPGATELELLPPPPPPLTASSGNDINNSGQVCGTMSPPDAPFTARAALYTDVIGWEEIADLGPLSDVAFAMNDQEVVIGFTSIANDIPRAWVWTRRDGARFLDELIDPAIAATVRLSTPVDINESGQILIQGLSNGERRAFLLTAVGDTEPVPGDVNNDQNVDTLDLLLLLSLWGPCDHDVCVGDFDGDGFVGISDLLVVLAGWSGI